MVMDFKPMLELLEREHVPGEEMTEAFLKEAVEDFSTDSARAKTVIRRLQTSDALGLVIGALRLLVSNEDAPEERSRGLQYIASLLTSGDLLPQLFLDDRILSSQAAATLARQAATIQPLLDVRLVGLVLTNQANIRGVVKSAVVLRALALVEAISDCTRLAPSLMQLLRHPCGRVRSKTALLLGRANRNPARVGTLLASPDARLRANAVESLWGDFRQDTLRTLWKATHDECSRVVVNALLGLCKAGDRNAHVGLLKLAESADPVRRCGAAWAMGESLDRQFSEAVERLAQDEDAKVRAMAEKSHEKLRIPCPVVPAPQPAAVPVDDPVEEDIPATRHASYVRIG